MTTAFRRRLVGAPCNSGYQARTLGRFFRGEGAARRNWDKVATTSIYAAAATP
ncbi:MAG: hypothetical protein ABIP94_02085 [Planctomycetota bacterium]